MSKRKPSRKPIPRELREKYARGGGPRPMKGRNTNRGRITIDEPGRTGRKKLDIDYQLVFALAIAGETNAGIAADLDISESTLVRRCASVLRKARAKRDSSLQARMFNSAMGGSENMMKWLSKQVLGMKDRVDHTSGDQAIVKALHGVSMEDLGNPTKTDPDDDEPGEGDDDDESEDDEGDGEDEG